jgi:XapX domain-containing protein
LVERQEANMTKTIAGLVLGLLIGAGCRWFGVPVPSPPQLLGALLVVAMTVGYMATDKLLTARLKTKKTSGAVEEKLMLERSAAKLK